MLTKTISLFLCFCLILEQSLFAQAIDLSHYFAHSPAQAILQSDKFRPLHLRYISYDSQANDFKLLLDKGDFMKGLSPKGTVPDERIQEETQTLMKYFFIGLSLPNEKFWVNLRPDSPDNIIDDDLAKTDIGRIFLEADVQLKKDTAGMTSPQTQEGKEYWDKLYKRAGELFGSENITIPTLTRPWIVPNEIIIREASNNAYIYKATLKVMLEEDYLTRDTPFPHRGGAEAVYRFSDPRLKELNEYSTQLIKELIIPKLTYAVNTSKRYALLRQVYYSLILAQWFKQKYKGRFLEGSNSIERTVPAIAKFIDSGSLTSNFQPLTSQSPYSKEFYFQQYQKSFQDGEYNLTEPVYTPYGQSIRRYMSGGIVMDKDVSSFSVITSKRNKFFNTAIPAFLISITTMVAPTINAQENPHLPNGWSIEQSTDIRQRALAILEKVDPWYEPSLFEDLVSLGKDVVPFLGEVVNKEVVDDRQIMVCQFSMGALVKIGGAEATEILIESLKHKTAYVRLAALRHSLKFCSKDEFFELAVNTENAGLHDKDVSVRAQTIKILGDTKEERALDAIAKIFSDEREGDNRLKAAAFFALVGFYRGNEEMVVEAMCGNSQGINDKNRYFANLAAENLCKVLIDSKELIKTEYAKMLFKFLDNAVVRHYLRMVISRNADLLGSLIILVEDGYQAFQKYGVTNRNDFNNIVFLLSLEETDKDKVGEYFEMAYKYAFKEFSAAMRYIYAKSLQSVIIKLSNDKEAKIRKGHIEGIANYLRNLSLRYESPPYKADENTEFRVKLYNPFEPHIFDKVLTDDDFKKKSKGGIVTYTKFISGKRVIIDCDPRGEARNYKGNIVEHIGEYHMTTYAGHSGAGGFFDLDAKISHLTTSETMGAESIIMILSCSSMKTYFRDIIRLFPYVHFIGTDEPTYTDRNAVVFLETIRGIVAGRPWEGIKMKVMEKMGYKPEHPFIYRFPNDEENKEKMILATNVIAVSGDSVNDDTIRFAPLLYTPKNEDTFHFEPEAVNVNVSEINPDNVIKAVEISGYVLGLNDTLKKHKDRLVPGGFEMPDNDEENACLITKLPNGSYKISVNTGYKNKSHLALTMMMAYELNLFFSNEEKGHIDHFDKLRGLQLISKLLKYRGREDLLKPFLEKYNLPNIALEQIWESADSHIDKNKRIDILNELVRAFGVVDIYDYPTLKGSGLLSYVSLNSGSVSSAVAENKKGASGSLSSPVADNKGGIAFNALPIQTEPVTSSVGGLFPGSGAFKGDLNAEWGKIQQLFNSGIRPSIQRISEYTAAAAASPLAGDKIDQVRSMLADMLRREEEDEKLPATEPALKSLISALEA